VSDPKQPDSPTPEELNRIELTKRENLVNDLDFELKPSESPTEKLPDLRPAEEETPTTPHSPPEPIPNPRQPAAKTIAMPFPNPMPLPKPTEKPVTEVEMKVAQPPTGVMPIKRPEWKVLEPEDHSDPVPHEQFEEHSIYPDWRLLAASVRGKLHAHKGGWREDSYCWGIVDDWTILAVADGAGSASHSRIGSNLACVTVVKKLQELLGGLKLGFGERQPPDSDLKRLRSLLANATEKARLNLVLESQQRKIAFKELSTTLLVVVHTPWHDKELLTAIQVGDGAIGLIASDGFRRLGFSDHGEYSAETRFLTSPGIELEFENRVVFSLPSNIQALALMTDGVSDDFFPEDQKLIELFQGNPIIGISTKNDEPVFGLLQKFTSASTGDQLRDWLRYEKRASSDDRTLMLMYRSRAK
jgi:serine/threonine protein phosphatase PrpC